MSRRWIWAAGVALAVTAALAQPKSPVVWNATLDPTAARPGEVATLVLHARIETGWHIYGVAKVEGPTPTAFTPAEGSPLQPLGGLREPAPQSHFDEGFQTTITTHAGEVELRQPLRVPAGTAPGSVPLAGTLKYQACTDKSCLPPAKYAVQLTLPVEPGDVRAAYRDAPPESSPATAAAPAAVPAAASGAAQAPVQVSAAEAARRRGLGTFLLVAFLAGLAALLTPCVFPMIPITVSFFTKQAGESRRQRVSLALCYGLGICVTYTVLGLVLALTMGATGAQRIATNPYFNLFFAGLFVFFAVSLFGYLELALPSGLVNRTSTLGRNGGYLGALFMGLTLTLAAFTCTVQFVGGVLVMAANGERLWPVLGMLAFSFAFALPFVLLALFPQYLASLPKSGGWLHDTKVVLAFVEVAAALKFVSNVDLVWQWRVVSRELVLGVWATTAFLTAVYLLGRLQIAGCDTPAKVGRGRQWGAALCLAATGYLAWGLTGARLEQNLESLLPPAGYGRGAQTAGDSAWELDYERGTAQAKAKGQLAFVDFTGVTCTNCRLMEQTVFTQPAVKQRLAQMSLVRLYTDQGEQAEQYRRMQVERYQTASLPFYAIVAPDGRTVATFDGMTRDVAKFTAFLDSALRR